MKCLYIFPVLLVSLASLITPLPQVIAEEAAYCPPHRRWIEKWREANARSRTREIAPAGTALYSIFAAQAAAGQAANMMLYQYDFVPGSERLSPRGYYQATKFAQRLQYLPYPLLIERTGSPALDEARRAHVMAALEEAGVALDSERVLSRRPTIRGLDGPDSMLINAGLLDLSSAGMSSPAQGTSSPGIGQTSSPQ
jgi:hypothetical protein